MENKAQNSPAEPLQNEESRNMANSKKDENSELIRLAKENLDYTKLIYEDTQKIRKYMLVRTIVNIVLILLTIAPIIAALIWLPSLLGSAFGSYFNGGGNMNDIGNVLKDLR